MYYDKYLKFTDEAQAMSVLYRKEGVVEANEELGIEANEGYDVPNFDNIDIIGTLYDPPLTEEGEPVALEGFHVNIRNYSPVEGLESFEVVPAFPRRVWAGDQ